MTTATEADTAAGTMTRGGVMPAEQGPLADSRIAISKPALAALKAVQAGLVAELGRQVTYTEVIERLIAAYRRAQENGTER